MRVSAKARYGLAALVYLCIYSHGQDVTTIANISEKLDISKIYLEQTFSALKKAGIVTSVKGAQGGYRLAKDPADILALDVLAALDAALFEPAEQTLKTQAHAIEDAMQSRAFEPLHQAVQAALSAVTLESLAEDAKHRLDGGGLMFYI